jgi:hypothetical protein
MTLAGPAGEAASADAHPPKRYSAACGAVRLHARVQVLGARHDLGQPICGLRRRNFFGSASLFLPRKTTCALPIFSPWPTSSVDHLSLERECCDCWMTTAGCSSKLNHASSGFPFAIRQILTSPLRDTRFIARRTDTRYFLLNVVLIAESDAPHRRPEFGQWPVP